MKVTKEPRPFAEKKEEWMIEYQEFTDHDGRCKNFSAAADQPMLKKSLFPSSIIPLIRRLWDDTEKN